jgi:hypothetical protein
MALADMDRDGDLDLFVGGRVMPGRYPEPASSYLYLNHQGQLVPDQTNNPSLNKIGLIAGCLFSDVNNDGWPDLVCACEWGPVRLLLNRQGRFQDATTAFGLDSLTGWWTGVTTGDFNSDGRLDIVAGNWGFNSPYQASPRYPARLYYGDFNESGRVDLIETYEELTPGRIVPRRNLNDMILGLPFLQARYPKHEQYAKATVAEILGDLFAKAGKLQATTLATTLFLNRGDHFEAQPLPPQAQWAPVFGINVADLDGDGHEDLFLSQNFFGTQVGITRLDAGRGLWLRGDGQGHFEPVPGQRSGLRVYGEQRGSAVGDFDEDGRVDLVVSQNGAETKLFRNRGAKPGLRIRLKGPPGNPEGIGAQLRLISNGQKGPLREVHAGSGYWSQDSSVQVLAAAEGVSLEVRWPDGTTTQALLPPQARELLVRPEGAVKIR